MATGQHVNRLRLRNAALAISCLIRDGFGARLCWLMLAAVWSSHSVAIDYRADAFSAVVVDKATRLPLEGVNVVAGWELKGGLEGGTTVGWAQVMEAVTDREGRFSFPAWGPVTVRRGRIYSASPLILLFKPGYTFTELRQRTRSWTDPAPSHMASDWDKRTIELEKFDGGPVEYSFSLSHVTYWIETLFRSDGCHGKKAPRFIRAVHQLSESFKQTPGTRPVIDLYRLGGLNRECGPVELPPLSGATR